MLQKTVCYWPIHYILGFITFNKFIIVNKSGILPSVLIKCDGNKSINIRKSIKATNKESTLFILFNTKLNKNDHRTI